MIRFLRALAALCILLVPGGAGAYTDPIVCPPPFTELTPAANAARASDAAFLHLRDMGSDAGYLAADRSTFFAMGTRSTEALPPYILAEGQLRIVLFLGKGTPLPGGLVVGGPASDIVRIFGPVYPVSRSDIYENEPRTGMYTENTHTFRDGRMFRYYTLTYADRNGRSVQFLVDRNTKTIAAAACWDDSLFSRPDTAAADALTRWGLWRLLFPSPTGQGALAL